MIVIGAGRVGSSLQALAAQRSVPCVLLDRAALKGRPSDLEAPNGDPVLLAVRNDDLDSVIASIPAHRRHDLVFLQNGAIRELLTEHGLPSASRGVLYLLAAERSGPISSPGRSVFTGPHASTVARWFFSLGLPSESVDHARFALYEMEKLLWLAIMGPLCEKTGQSVSEVAREHRDEIAALVAELSPVLRASWGVDPEQEWIVDRIVDYSTGLGSYRASVKEWRWRNGWLRDRARRFRKLTPLHDALIAGRDPG